MIFDPSMTKKKKKKKKPFLVDEEGGETLNEDAPQPEVKEAEFDGGDDREVELEEDEGKKKGMYSQGMVLYFPHL